VWFYNDVYDDARWKHIRLELTVREIDGNTPDGWAWIIAGGSTGAWSALQNDRPPLPDDANTLALENQYIDRVADANNYFPTNTVFKGAVNGEKLVVVNIDVKGYNPEWVFIDIIGRDVEIVGGYIWHRCISIPDIVNMDDYAILADNWLVRTLWPPE
jgi:hypothetical protein